MSRLESQALKTVESADAQTRIRDSEDRIMVLMVRFGEHAIRRRRAAAAAARGVEAEPVQAVTLTESQRTKILAILEALVAQEQQP
jgi:hypothetical protein